MSAMKATNRDTYRASGITLILIGALYLLEKFVNFSALGIPWVTNTSYIILYAAIIFLLFKRDKTVGVVLLCFWLIFNMNFLGVYIGSLSGYILPLVLLVAGLIFYIVSRR